MLWRVRTTLPDPPGALAVLARDCGAAGVNILGLQIFPGVDSVTDELVLRVPAGWDLARLTELIEESGGVSVIGMPSTEHALVDQPTRYVQAARTILAQPARFPEVVAALFDAEADPADDLDGGLPGEPAGSQDVMEMTVGEVDVQVRRRAPFTPTERARGSAMADLVTQVLEDRETVRGATSSVAEPDHGATPDYVADDDGVAAWVEGVVVGHAIIRPPGADGPDAAMRQVVLRVEPSWQRRGIGTRLLSDVARIASGQGLQEIVISTRSDNQAVLPMVLAAGLRGRIRMAADRLTVRIPVRDLKPLPV